MYAVVFLPRTDRTQVILRQQTDTLNNLDTCQSIFKETVTGFRDSFADLSIGAIFGVDH